MPCSTETELTGGWQASYKYSHVVDACVVLLLLPPSVWLTHFAFMPLCLFGLPYYTIRGFLWFCSSNVHKLLKMIRNKPLYSFSLSLGPTVSHGYISAQGYRQMTENGQIWWIEWGFANCFSLDAVSNPLFSPNSVISHNCLFVEQVKNRI